MARKSDKAQEAEVVKETKSKVTTKAVKKDAAKVAAAIGKTAKDLRDLTEAELHAALKTAKEDLLAAQKMLKANELPSSHVIRKSRKVIARLHTVLTEKVKEAKNV
jgi:ribosomal protein L29